MKRKILWWANCCLVTVALVLASCAPAEKPAPAPKPVPAPAPTPAPTPVPAPEKVTVGKPKYGGTLVTCLTTPILGFDEGFIGSPPGPGGRTIGVTNEHLFMPDWAKANASTGKYGWQIGNFCPFDLHRGILAESWEAPDDETIIFKIRKGIRFHDKPPTSGREMTAEDVAFSIKRMFELPTCYWYGAYRGSYPVSVTAPDKYTVVVKTPVKTNLEATALLLEISMEQIATVPKDMVLAKGNLRDWKDSCGTGPYMLVDYVAQSSATLKRNPGYWQKDPFYPENTLPYPDRLTYLIVEDKSTRLAGLRTGKLDVSAISDITWEDYKSLKQTAPKLMERKTLFNFPNKIYMRVDTKPFSDIRVRRALNMAVDRKAIVESYWGGNAEVLSSPLLPIPDHPFFTPLNELPATTQEMYQYNPEKAKKLLAEAGYPAGFKMNVLCYKAQVDELSIFKDYFAKIGVDLTLDIKEYSVYVSTHSAHKHKDSVYVPEGTGASVWKLNDWRSGTVLNKAMASDPVIDKAYEAVHRWENYRDTAKRNQIYKEVYAYIIDQAYEVHFPTPYVYTMWWPWVKNYHGEGISYGAHVVFWAYPWIDQELKQTMTGRR